MNRKAIIAVLPAIALLLAVPGAVWLWRRSNEKAQQAQSLELHARYVELLTSIVPRVWPDLPWDPGSIPGPDAFEKSLRHRGIEYGLWTARAEAVWMYLDADGRLLRIQNRQVMDAARARRGADEWASLTLPEVIERAHEYIELVGESIPANYAIVDIFFGTDDWLIDDPVWSVTWKRMIDGVRFDDSQGKWEFQDRITVRFHEQLGLLSFSRTGDIYPAPRSMEVRLSATDAVRRAAGLAPRVLAGPYSQTWRGGSEGQSITAVSDVRLVIFEPNWMLNPRRSTFWTEAMLEPPRETRLCWRVELHVTAHRQPDGELAPAHRRRVGVVFIFIDARTGECVGATFL